MLKKFMLKKTACMSVCRQVVCCKVRRMGVMWSHFLEGVISLSAAFCTDWSFLMTFLGTLYRRELLWSSLKVTKGWIRISVACVDNYFLMREMVRRWWNADLQTLFTWGSIDIVVSKIATMFLACGEGLIMSVPKRRGGRDCCGLYFENT